LPSPSPLTAYREGAKEAVREYYEKIGGRPEKQTKKRKSLGDTATMPQRKKSRKSQGSENGTPDSENTSDWVPKAKNWDKEIQSIDTIMRDPDSGNLFVYLNWNNNKKSKVSIQQCYEKCPMKVR
jgi:chromobox protein 1